MDAINQQSWFRRNQKGGLLAAAGCLLLACLCVAFVTGIVTIVFGAIRASDVYQAALEEARANPDVVAALGEPIEPGWWVTGSIETRGNQGEADFTVPISGPNNAGQLLVVAEKSGGVWEFLRLEVIVDGRDKPINLLNRGR